MKENIMYMPIPPSPEKLQMDKEVRALRTKKISYAIAGVLVFVICTMLLAAMTYFWVTGFMGAGFASAPAAFTGEIPAEPKAMSINSTINVKYIRIEQEYVPTYTLSYEATFKYVTTGRSTAYIPLPSGSIENLVVKLNGNIISEPSVSDRNIVIFLPIGTNNVYLSYNAEGSREYSHQVPTRRLIEKFYMRLELRNVEWYESLPRECLTPDIISTSGKTTVFIWDKENAVLDKKIVIKLPKWENPFDTYFGSIPAVFILTLLLGLFYYEAFRRVGKLWKIEYIGFLLVPFIFLYLSLGVGIAYIELLPSAIIALAIGIFTMYVIKRRVVNVSKGFTEIFLLPSFSLIFVSTLSLIKTGYSLVIGTVALIVAIALGIKFFKTYERPKEKLSVEELSVKVNILESEREKLEKEFAAERERLEKELATEREDKRKVLTRIKEGVFAKRFCPYCKYSVAPDFDFCPKCGKDIKRIIKCEKCGALVSIAENELYCPNCGEQRGGRND
ncbi:MAG: zinc ribbon domain-containing protein [Candidatus Thermoplasmatota archaeon]